MILTYSELGVILVVLSLVMFWPLGILPTIRSVMVLVGLILIGTTNGALIRFAGRVTAILGHLFNSVAAVAFGVAVPTLAVIVALAFLIHDLHPRHKARGRTYWLAWAVGLVIAAGSSGIAALNGLPGGVQQTISSTTTTLGG